jgi:hypothetical protein
MSSLAGLIEDLGFGIWDLGFSTLIDVHQYRQENSRLLEG